MSRAVFVLNGSIYDAKRGGWTFPFATMQIKVESVRVRNAGQEVSSDSYRVDKDIMRWLAGEVPTEIVVEVDLPESLPEKRDGVGGKWALIVAFVGVLVGSGGVAGYWRLLSGEDDSKERLRFELAQSKTLVEAAYVLTDGNHLSMCRPAREKIDEIRVHLSTAISILTNEE